MENEVKENEVLENGGKKATRHNFVSFWLWLSLICNVLAAMLFVHYITTPDYMNRVSMGHLAATGDAAAAEMAGAIVMIRFLINAILCIVNVIGFWMLLRWKKSGFTLFFISGAMYVLASIILAITSGAEIGSWAFSIVGYLIGFGLSVGILYAILHLCKNGISYWSQLK